MDKNKPMRKRSVTKSFRLSEEEEMKFREKIKLSGLTTQDYILRRILDDKAIECRKVVSTKPKVVIENGPEIRYELKKTGANLNQAVAGLNKCLLHVYDTEFQNELESALKLLTDAVKENIRANEIILEIGERLDGDS